jgi:hypothetical protein
MVIMEVVWSIAFILTITVIWIVSFMVKNEMRVHNRVGLFVWVYGMVCCGCLMILWYALIIGAYSGYYKWSYEVMK